MGILKTAATVAVASSVHGRVQRRQQQRWAAQDHAAAPPVPQQAPPMAAQQAAPMAAPQADTGERLAQLAQLGELKTAGVLSEAEFEREKARILGG
ncbi:SHOCT domain-containing protein [Trebonia kvetii]|uniref:SHOCT domain-containing protein n=1 Tax=Trebonia kvetii TaxID=2480626 RepID=A0A6P2BPM5_9ACTN|nr:SHOCT domain-containing protein [Trebonia kvetii]TVZ00607.1 SHOCT domain-containing protein [Trebonia kvetii]